MILKFEIRTQYKLCTLCMYLQTNHENLWDRKFARPLCSTVLSQGPYHLWFLSDAVATFTGSCVTQFKLTLAIRCVHLMSSGTLIWILPRKLILRRYLKDKIYSYSNTCAQTWQGNFRVAVVKVNSIVSSKLKVFWLNRIRILLHVLVCSLAEYFYDLCRTLTRL